MNENRIIFTYDSADGSLRLSRESSGVIPIFDPEDISGVLRELSRSEQPVSRTVQVALGNGRNYCMEVAPEQPQRLLDVTLTEID